jgi:geranylgeranyl diphosphate synthase type II
MMLILFYETHPQHTVMPRSLIPDQNLEQSLLSLSPVLLPFDLPPRRLLRSARAGQDHQHQWKGASMTITDYLEAKRMAVDQFLDQVTPPAVTPPATLHESMRYSLMAGGKRIRPILTVAAAEAVGGDAPGLMAVACSLELIHTYSLIHDDLPSMDNDDYRRGKPTNHKVYGEAIAILTGDALLTMAFDWISRPDLMKGCDPARQVRLIQELAHGAGNRGMVGGQVLDIQAENRDIDLPALQTIHKHKTGMLIRAAVRMGAIAAGATDRQLDDLTGYAEDIGLAFQIADDVLNVTGTREELGKNPNTDAERGKKTYPAFYGVDGARQLADDCVERAIGRLSSFGPTADPLREIARYITARKH